MAKTTVVVEFDLPSILLVLGLWSSVHDLIADNLDVIGFWPNQVDKQASNDRRHTGAEDNDRHLVLPGPLIEGFETWIKLDVLTEKLNAFWKWSRDAIDHLLERISNVLIRASGGKSPGC